MAPAPRGLSVTDAAGGVVLLAGELDSWTGAQLRRRLLAPPPVRVIDLADVTFIDASGLQVLLDASEQRHPGRRLRLRNPSPRVLQLCDITGLTAALLEPTDSD